MSVGVAIRKYGHITLAVILCLLGSLLVYVLGNRLFEIRTIEVVSTNIKVVVDQNRVPKNLLFFPAEQLREQILKDNPLLDQVTFKKKLPHTLLILASERAPIARLSLGTLVIALDKNGVILTLPTTWASLPMLLFTIPSARIGERVTNSQILASLAFIEETRSFLPLVSVEPYDSASLLAKTSKIDIFIPQEADQHRQATTLQTLLLGFRIKGTLPTKIDLRFDKPIVTFNK